MISTEIMPTISIIVPVYNSSRFLSQCLDSIVAQTYEDFEVLIIDDGSTDSSEEIARLYSENDSRFIVLSKAKGGVGSARNYGLRMARGQFIVFIDSDDWIVPDYLLLLINGILGADHAAIGYQEFGDSNIIHSFPCKKITRLDKNTASFIDQDGEEKTDAIHYLFCWAQIFKKSIIDEFKVSFNERLCLAEDTYFVLDYLSHVSFISQIEGVGYMYRRSKMNFYEKFAMDVESFSCHIAQMIDSIEQYERSFECKLMRLRSKNVEIYLKCYQTFLTHSKPYMAFRSSILDFYSAHYSHIESLVPISYREWFRMVKLHPLMYYARFRTIPFRKKLRSLFRN